ncbi:MAG: methyltransferase domain-containing protein [Rhodospirillales bacterium]|nr:methyltransferase domain-containing protein [Rhodospirillales bacterium]MDH3968637.1 methyltransferase domain-containing protein [Rhodospirillales bacterium]
MKSQRELTERQSHASRDGSSRLKKAAKIVEILSRRVELTGARVLDIGTGIGLIAEYLQEIVGPTGRVAAVDRVCQLGCTGDLDFRLVEGAGLPFDDESFDIVISNHVIEHIGPREEQLKHLAEIRRVLARNGILYLAAPNRWAPVEPHFRLPLLSWLPEGMRSAYVRLAGRGKQYDCFPPSRRTLLCMLAESGLPAAEVTLEALRITARRELPGALASAIARTPDPILRLTMGVIPTFVFIIDKSILDEDSSRRHNAPTPEGRGGISDNTPAAATTVLRLAYGDFSRPPFS